jgi:hypothetical protein
MLGLSRGLKRSLACVALIGLPIVVVGALVAWNYWGREPAGAESDIAYQPRKDLDAGGNSVILKNLEPWNADATLEEIAEIWRRAPQRRLAALEQKLASPSSTSSDVVFAHIEKALVHNFEGHPDQAYEALSAARTTAEGDPALARDWRYTIIYLQGVSALRRGENENCILCRGESSCILPIAPSAVHVNRAGSEIAARHFMEYLERFPHDLEIRWLLNLAHMTLGEHPEQVDPRFVLSLDRFARSRVEIGKFRDVGHVVGVNRLNMAGGAIMDDFDSDGLLDLVTTSMDPAVRMTYYRNLGNGKFEDRAEAAGLAAQRGGLNCVQADYNNDGRLDIFVPRGAWFENPMRPSLLENVGDGFRDVTEKAGLHHAVNSNAAQWADYDNDGRLDLFVCCERQLNRLYRQEEDGTFREVAAQAGLQGAEPMMTKGVAWVDYDNDRFPDLFVNHLNGTGQLFHNERNGAFVDVTAGLGIAGPRQGFSCWAWDYNNDGWLDVFATCYDRTLADVVKGIQGEPHGSNSNRLYRNENGLRFVNATKESGLDLVFSTMGSNFADLDNDGYLDMYLGTGEPNLASLMPNRMFLNQAGTRFAEITGASRTGNLQKGHGVACGDWDQDGNVDVFIEMGGAIPGDKYHNVLFQNPGSANRWLTLKLVGKQTNRSAIGARIKIVTDGSEPLTIHRHISSGSSFGANPLRQTIGLGPADKVARLEIHWPTSDTTQVFEDVAVNQALEVTEFEAAYRKLDYARILLPE